MHPTSNITPKFVGRVYPANSASLSTWPGLPGMSSTTISPSTTRRVNQRRRPVGELSSLLLMRANEWPSSTGVIDAESGAARPSDAEIGTCRGSFRSTSIAITERSRVFGCQHFGHGQLSRSHIGEASAMSRQ
jgi:hypothetical protein